jgi:hypothetical protein
MCHGTCTYANINLEIISRNWPTEDGMEMLGSRVYLVYFGIFFGIFLCMEMGFVTSCVHCLGVHSNLPWVQWLTHGASAAGSAWLHCVVRQVQHMCYGLAPLS